MLFLFFRAFFFPRGSVYFEGEREKYDLLALDDEKGHASMSVDRAKTPQKDLLSIRLFTLRKLDPIFNPPPLKKKKKLKASLAALAAAPPNLLLALASHADETAAASDAAGGGGGFKISPLELLLALAPVVFYTVLSLYRKFVNPRASISDGLFIVVALVIVANVISILVFHKRIY